MNSTQLLLLLGIVPVCSLSPCHGLLGHFSRLEPIILEITYAFLSMTSQNVCCVKGLLGNCYPVTVVLFKPLQQTCQSSSLSFFPKWLWLFFFFFTPSKLSTCSCDTSSGAFCSASWPLFRHFDMSQQKSHRWI